MDVEVIAPSAGVSEARAQADQGTQELSSDEEPAAAPPSPPKPKAKSRASGARAPVARARAKRAPKQPSGLPEQVSQPQSEKIDDLPEQTSGLRGSQPKSEEIDDPPEQASSLPEQISQPNSEEIDDLPEHSSQAPTPKAKARVRKAAPKKTRPPFVEQGPPPHWAAPPQVGYSSFDLVPRIDAALHDYIRQQEWADRQRREEVVRNFRLF